MIKLSEVQLTYLSKLTSSREDVGVDVATQSDPVQMLHEFTQTDCLLPPQETKSEEPAKSEPSRSKSSEEDLTVGDREVSTTLSHDSQMQVE